MVDFWHRAGRAEGWIGGAFDEGSAAGWTPVGFGLGVEDGVTLGADSLHN